jgi:ketosteroid isomerase-like protein
MPLIVPHPRPARASASSWSRGSVRPVATGTLRLLRSYVDALEARDWDGLAALLHPDIVYRLPQTREVVRGRDAYVRWNREYPDGWHLRLVHAYADESGGAAQLDVTIDGQFGSTPALVFVQVADGLLVEITDFWPDAYEPPAGREHLAEREPY